MDRKILGVESFSNWREKDAIIRRLMNEFKGKVKLSVEGNFVFYEHFGNFEIY